MQLLSGKVIFLTGGSAGIGFECAKAYAEAGANVVVAASSPEPVEDAVRQLGSAHLGIVCDVSKADDVEIAIAKTLARYGKLDAIHNNAGVASPSKPLHETSDEEWGNLMDVNLKSILYTTRYGFEALKESKGCILNTSSLVGEIGQENHAAYTATKGAMNTLTKSMALDYAQYKIRVNAVLPAGVWTPMLREWSKEQPNPASIAQYLDDIHPLGYCPEGDVIADACVFLLSEKARFITGTILPVSGGAELGYRSVR
ncbi:SDR family NAD(P)-dependent oxidoreductase [Pedobacter panaciterrae]|jgi:Dehydrogenases with different specificities (related to short-chain alcohol dehydrogenases)|uniref:SDR family oxidoreductase n=1 Tax=Pedobacter panaciterrae TaxID=363849 RepID=A0ABU8NPI5_9SPHI|nr:SDR family oxidoreductase [Pedobacter panaciterrae]NQX52224.1 SDR family oxidoreductase [Pedobacter panaciterrae]